MSFTIKTDNVTVSLAKMSDMISCDSSPSMTCLYKTGVGINTQPSSLSWDKDSDPSLTLTDKYKLTIPTTGVVLYFFKIDVSSITTNDTWIRFTVPSGTIKHIFVQQWKSISNYKGCKFAVDSLSNIGYICFDDLDSGETNIKNLSVFVMAIS